jgi:pimeloyl-[acyl-carrier protein] methyl ester esterase
VSGPGKGKTPLLFLHGWAMTPAIWQASIAALGESGHAVEIHAPALPGHGAHAASPGGASLAAWAEALAPALPAGAALIGWSLGALLALELARIQPERVARLILIGATARFVAAPDWPHGLDAATVEAFIDDYERRPAATLRRFLALQTLGDDARRQLLPRLAAACVPHPDPAPPRPALADGLRILAAADLRSGLAAIAQPVHIIHGAGDALMPPAAAHWLAGALPRARLTLLENRGHALPLSSPAECAALIRAHLDANGAPP